MSTLAIEPMIDQQPEEAHAHILVVDDDESVRSAIHEFMRRSGYWVLSAGSGEKALEIMADSEIDVVITDIMMPGMDGLDLTDRIREKFDADVIVMTGYGGTYSYEEAVSKGASDFVFKPVRFEELRLRLRRVLRERRLTRDRDEMMSALKKLAITDDLTKLYNSRHFYSQLELEVDRSNRYDNPLALLLLDIDYFKEYNDSYGHLEGDKVLIRLGEVIRSLLRRMDSAYRYGGEEFTIILPETGGKEATTVAHRIRAAVEGERFQPAEGIEEKVTISVGVTEYVPDEDVPTLVNRSDKAMYESKEGGRNRVSVLFADTPPA